MAYTSVLLIALPSHDSAKSSLDDIKTVTTIISNTVTAAAILAGGIWAYFKYAKGRTFRPRVSVNMLGQWQAVNGRHLLQTRVTVKNVGASKIVLRQEGTGLKASTLGKAQPRPPASVKWDDQKVFTILKEHDWIEPGETVSDDLLLDLATPDPVPIQLEGRLVFQRRRRNIEIFARKMIPYNAVIGDAVEDKGKGNGNVPESRE